MLRVVPKQYRQITLFIETILDLNTLSLEGLIDSLRAAEDRGNEEEETDGPGRLLFTEEQCDSTNMLGRIASRTVMVVTTEADMMNNGSSSARSGVQAPPQLLQGQVLQLQHPQPLLKGVLQAKEEEALLANAPIRGVQQCRGLGVDC
jgi:hypothetical protein